MMFTLSPATRIFVALQPVDMRGGFNTFFSYVQVVLAQDPLSGQLFCFTNRSRNRLRVLCWDGSGLWLAGRRGGELLPEARGTATAAAWD